MLDRGGVFAAVDVKSGIVISKAYSEFSDTSYICHPDTNAQIIGFQIPKWNEAVTMAKEMSALLPSVRFISWDLAYTDNGWVLVEGNELGQVVMGQIARRQGINKEFIELMKRGKMKGKYPASL